MALALLGVAAGMGQAPLDAWFVALPALALWLNLAQAQGRDFLHGWVFGIGYFAFSLRWIVEPFMVNPARDGWMAPFALVLMAAGAGLFWGLASWLAARNLWRLVLLIIVAEVTRSLILTGFPWALVGHIWIDTPLAQIAAFTGPHGLTLVTMLLAWSLAALAAGRSLAGAVPVAAVAISLLLDPGPLSKAQAESQIVRMVQPNVPQSEKWDPVLRLVHFNRMLALTSEGAVRPDLIVWPETAVSQLMEFAQPSFDLMSEAAQGAPLITGVQRRRTGEIYHNSLVVLGRGGVIQNIYDKQHLVPFGEYFPGGELAARLGLRGFASSQGFGFTDGQTSASLDIRNIGRVRPLICYEGIFAEEITQGPDRPRLMVLITNDAWFGDAAGPFQHLAQARLRAIEQGLPMVRVANTGISAMIDGKGRLTQTMPLGHAGYVDVELPPALAPTFYARFGDWPALCVLIALLLVHFLTGRRDFR